jgi:hypothetical protein
MLHIFCGGTDGIARSKQKKWSRATNAPIRSCALHLNRNFFVLLKSGFFFKEVEQNSSSYVGDEEMRAIERYE